MPELSRRGLLGGLIGIIAAPAIVRATSLMPVKALEQEIGFDALLGPGDRAPYLASANDLAARLQAVTRRAFLPRLFATAGFQVQQLNDLALADRA
jgi:hypothetical protein